MRIVDEQGLAAFSMRALAASLGTGPMTLYNYVRDREELEDLLVEAVMSGGRPAEQTAKNWQAEVRSIMTGMWKAVRAHPNAIPLIATRRTTNETTLEIAEALLRALARGGKSGVQLLTAFRTLNGFFLGLAQSQLAAGNTAARESATLKSQSVSDRKFPKLHEIAKEAAHVDADREFYSGLDIIIGGLS